MIFGKICRQAVCVAAMLLALLAGVSASVAPARQLTITYMERPPYYYTENGVAQGFLVDLARRILAEAGLSANFTPMPPKRILLQMEQEEDVCSVGWFKTAERMDIARFSLPIYRDRPIGILMKADDRDRFARHESFEQLFSDTTLTLGIVEGFSYGRFLDNLMESSGTAMHRTTGRQAQLVDMLAAGRIDYMLVQDEEAWTLISVNGLAESDYALRAMADAPPGNLRHFMCSRKTSDAVMHRLNAAIERLVGRLDR